MEGMDGVVAVGGDGLVNEVVMGLLLVACRRDGVNPHDPEVQLPETHLRLGIIPGEAREEPVFLLLRLLLLAISFSSCIPCFSLLLSSFLPLSSSIINFLPSDFLLTIIFQ